MVEIFVLGLFVAALYMFVCFLLWRILRRLEWLCLYLKGIGDTYLKPPHDQDFDRRPRN